MGVFTGEGVTFLEITKREKKRLIETYYEEHALATSKLN
jgi:hypothetical protein